MEIFKAFVASVIFMFSVSSAFAGSCEIKDLQSRDVRGRAKSIEFKDGRTVTIVGRVHGVRGSLNLLQTLLSDELTGISNREFLQDLDYIKNNNHKFTEGINASNADQDSEGDVHFAKELIKQKKIAFIADEITTERLQELSPQIVNLLKDFKHALKLRKIPFTSESLALFRAAIGIVGPYFTAVNPSSVKSIRLIGIEDQKATTGDLGSLTLCSMLGSRLIYENYDRRESSDWKSILSFQSEVMHKFEIGEFNADWSHLREAEILALPTAQNNDVVRQYAEACAQVPMGLEMRDKATALNLTLQKSSGVFFVGKLHLNDLVSKVQQLCVNEN